MTKATYTKIKVDMKFRQVKVIIKNQKPALYYSMTSSPSLLYKGCAWTKGYGVGLQYVRGLLAPLGSATLTRKYLNQCGLVPGCA